MDSTKPCKPPSLELEVDFCLAFSIKLRYLFFSLFSFGFLVCVIFCLFGLFYYFFSPSAWEFSEFACALSCLLRAAHP